MEQNIGEKKKKSTKALRIFFSSQKGFLWHSGTLLVGTVPSGGSKVLLMVL